MPISGPGREANAEAVSYEAIRAAWQRLRMPYAPGASEMFQWNRPLALERLQAVQHRLSTLHWETCCEVDRVQLHTEKRDPLHRGEFALFPVDPKPQPAEVAEHRVPVFAQQCSRLGQHEPVVEVVENGMPASLNGTRAASTTLVKTRGDRDSPKGRTLYWYARPSNAKRRNGLCRGRIETWKYASFRSIAANQSNGRMHWKMRLCVSILNGSLWRARFRTRRSKIGRNPPPFLGTMKYGL